MSRPLPMLPTPPTPPTLPNIPATLLIGFDPGKDKCGIALAKTSPLRILQHEVVGSDIVIAHIQSLLQAHPIPTLVIGNQTTSKQWQQRLRTQLEPPPSIISVDERNTSLLARDRYWQMFPPQGLQRLIPEGLRQPPKPIDDIVAILLIERYLNSLKTGSAR